MLKMYILIREALPEGHPVLAAAHASLACYRKFEDRPEMQTWIEKSFRKVVCAVSDEEFERAKQVADHVVLTESSLGREETAIAFCPRAEWPGMFRYLRLWGKRSKGGR